MSGLDSWRHLQRQQAVDWAEVEVLDQTVATMRRLDGLVNYDDCTLLHTRLRDVALGRALVIQGGDCVETFARNCPSYVSANVHLLTRLGESLCTSLRLPSTLIGRFAGQYAKPRTRLTDEGGLPIWRGDMVNSREEVPAARVSDANNLLLGFDNSRNALAWAREVNSEVFSSHEAVVLEYEDALVRPSPVPDRGRYASSAHFLWVGYRTNDPAEAHISFAASICNAIGIKVGPDTTPTRFAQICKTLNPERLAGRLTAIIRLGQADLESTLPKLAHVAQSEGAPIVWMCDPMHANNARTDAGVAVRYMDAMRKDLRTYADVHAALGTWPGGLHLEMTSDNVFECQDTEGASLPSPTVCPAIDPRLNAEQAEDLTKEFAAAVYQQTRNFDNRI